MLEIYESLNQIAITCDEVRSYTPLRMLHGLISTAKSLKIKQVMEHRKLAPVLTHISMPILLKVSVAKILGVGPEPLFWRL